jgi:hypothetical protein
MVSAVRYPATVLNDVEAMNYASDRANMGVQNTTSTTIATTPVTLTAAQFVNGVIDVTVANSTTALTSPTAAAIVAAIPNAQVGDRFGVSLMNIGSGTLTWTLGTGVTGKTTNDVTTVATNKGMSYVVVLTNVTAGAEAAKIQQLGFAAA